MAASCCEYESKPTMRPPNIRLAHHDESNAFCDSANSFSYVLRSLDGLYGPNTMSIALESLPTLKLTGDSMPGSVVTNPVYVMVLHLCPGRNSRASGVDHLLAAARSTPRRTVIVFSARSGLSFFNNAKSRSCRSFTVIESRKPHD